MPATAETHSSTLSLVAYRGDAKTLLAFNLSEQQAKDLAGFTIQVKPPKADPYYLFNTLRFENPDEHAQVTGESPNSSVNAPFHKFRWVHVLGSTHQGLSPAYGTYVYAVTPRYFDDKGSLQPLDPGKTATVEVEVGPLDDGAVQVGFTRGYVQSQAYVNHFGSKASIRPKNNELLFDTAQLAGTNDDGRQYTYAEQYAWSGHTAREKIFALLAEVQSDAELSLDVFAYDLKEPDVIKILLDLARQGRVRIILDDADLHHSETAPTPEDQFESLFLEAAKESAAPDGQAAIMRGHFKRYAHDKILIVLDADGKALKVVTGSTNFSVTGLYVNANHVLAFGAGTVADRYADLFETVWKNKVSRKLYLKSPLASERFTVPDPPPAATITFAPHPKDFANELLQDIVARIGQEGGNPSAEGSVLFAVMDISGENTVYDALNAVHADQSIFSMGISDRPNGISLYKPGSKTGILVSGKPSHSDLPPPFNQVPDIGGTHEIHHKFVVCGFTGSKPVAYCGSSNLAQGGEEENGDNLLRIHDPDIVTAFAIEALILGDHYHFLNALATAGGGPAARRSSPPPAAKRQAAVSAGWFLPTTDRWTAPYFDPDDLRFVDRELFCGVRARAAA